MMNVKERWHQWWPHAWPDAAGVALLLLAVIALTWPLWRTISGVVNFVDYNLPVSAEAAGSALHQSLSPWSGEYGLGAPNVGFLGTVEFLWLFRLLSAPFGVAFGSRSVLILLLWMDALGAYVVLRASYRVGVAAACAAALFYVLNPWVYDAVSQGHLYTLEVLAVAPFLVLAVPRLKAITTAAIIGIAIATAVAFGSDYHFGLLILVFLGIEGGVLVVRGKARRAGRLFLGIGAGLGLLSVFLFPYVMSLGAIRSTNSPASSDLAYFSRFTSWTAGFTLLRPGMNAWAEVGTLGSTFRVVWSFICVAISVIAIAIVLRGGWKRLTGSIVLPSCALVSIGLANGTNGLMSGIATWVYSHVPLATIFRDPSKFLLFPLLLYVPAVALLSQGEVPGLLRGDPARPRRQSVWAVAAPVAILVLFAPLVVPGIGTIATVPADSDTTVPTPGARVAYLPPWQFVRYPGQAVPVNDPVQIYPRVAAAGLGPDYDLSSGNAFLRWLYTALYFRRTDSFYNLARLAGVSDVVVRPGLGSVAGYSLTQQMFAPEHLLSALRTQHPSFGASSEVAGGDVVWHVPGARAISSSRDLLRVRGSNLGVLNGVGDLTNLGSPAICFEPSCPPGNDGLTVGVLGDVPPAGSSAPDDLQIETLDSYDRKVGDPWISGRVAYAEGFGAVTEQLANVAVGVDRAQSSMRLVGEMPSAPRLWLQLLRGPEPITYTADCGRQSRSRTVPRTLGSYVWTWTPVGKLEAGLLASGCTVTMRGALGAVAGGAVTSGSAVRSEEAGNDVGIFVSPAVGADSWRRAKGASFDYPGVTSTAAIVADGGSLRFDLPSFMSPRHLYVNVAGISGDVQLHSRDVRSAGTRAIKRDERAWVDLGELPAGESADVSVTGGTAAIIGIAIAAPGDMTALKNAGASAAEIGVEGNTGLQDTGDVAVSGTGQTNGTTYLIVRSSADGFWSLDGRAADGTYAGFGQLYTIDRGGSTLQSVLRQHVAIGIVVSGLIAAALVIAGLMVWWRGPTGGRHNVRGGSHRD